MGNIEVEKNIKIPKINGAPNRVADLCAEIQTEIQGIRQELTQLPSAIASAISEAYPTRANS